MKFEQFLSAEALNATGDTLHLSEREKHLIGIAVTSTRGCIKCTGSRIKKALEAGIPDSTLIAAVDLSAAVNAGVTLAIAIQGAELVGVDSASHLEGCTDGSCTVGVG